MITSSAADARAITLDALAAHWRIALDVAAAALLVAKGCRTKLGFAIQELDDRRGRLARERDTIARLLGLVAHDEHIQLHGSLSDPRGTTQTQFP